MGKRIISQRRGRGTHTYKSRNANFKHKLEFKDSNGRVKDIIRDAGRNVPLMLIEYENGEKSYLLAPEGIGIRDDIKDVVMPLSEIPESTPIFAIEKSPNSGPAFCRSSDSVAVIVSKDSKSCIVRFPSKKMRTFNLSCRAIRGTPAGGGRLEKPFVKAGTKWITMHKRGKLYPRTSANAMNAVDHPYGGSYSGVNKPKAVSRHAPPGRKVGSIAASRMGRKKR